MDAHSQNPSLHGSRPSNHCHTFWCIVCAGLETPLFFSSRRDERGIMTFSRTGMTVSKIRVKRVRPLRPAVDRRVGKPKPPRARRPRWRAKFITSGFGASGSTQNVCRAVVPRMVPRLPQPVQWRSMRAAIASAPRGPQSSRRAARDSPELGRGGRHGIRTPGVRRAAPRALQRAPGAPASTAGWWSAAAARAPRGL